MSCLQAIACLPALNKNSALSRAYRLPKASLRLKYAVSGQRRSGLVCLFGDKKKSENPSEASSSPWKSIENAMGRLKKEQSIEDLLRQQMDKQEYYADNDGNKGGNSPGGGGGGSGGGGGGSGSSGESPEDGGISGIVDEFVQVILATIGFIFLAEDITRIFQDIIKFIFSGKKSIRLKRLLFECGSFYQNLTTKNVKEQMPEDWLETAILQTPTWYDSPEKYNYIIKAYLKSKSGDVHDEDEDEDDDEED